VNIDLAGLPPDTWGQPLGSQIPTGVVILGVDGTLFLGTAVIKGTVIDIDFDVVPVSGPHILQIQISWNLSTGT
jgi:hypothetical protein